MGALISALFSPDFIKAIPALVSLFHEVFGLIKHLSQGDPGKFISDATAVVGQIKAANSPKEKQDALDSLANLISKSSN